jgi:hypothetical protein
MGTPYHIPLFGVQKRHVLFINLIMKCPHFESINIVFEGQTQYKYAQTN